MSTRYHLITEIMIQQQDYQYSLKDLQLMSVKTLRKVLKDINKNQ